MHRHTRRLVFLPYHGGDVAQEPGRVVLERLPVAVRPVARALLLVVVRGKDELQHVLPLVPAGLALGRVVGRGGVGEEAPVQEPGAELQLLAVRHGPDLLRVRGGGGRDAVLPALDRHDVLVDGLHRLLDQVPLLRQDDGRQPPPQGVGVAHRREGRAVSDRLQVGVVSVEDVVSGE